MAAIDDMIGLIPITMAAGVTMKVTESMFGSVNRMQQQQPAPARQRRSTRRRTTRRSNNGTGFGNFSNVGLF